MKDKMLISVKASHGLEGPRQRSLLNRHRSEGLAPNDLCTRVFPQPHDPG